MHRGSQKNFVVVLNREILKRLNDLREKGIRDFGNNQAEDAAFPRNQRPRLRVRVISKFVHYFPNPLSELSVYRRNMINGA